MKVVAFNCNLSKEKKYIDKIFSNFLDGVRENCNEVISYNLCELNILPCLACTNNIGFVPNVGCCIKDSMQEIYPKIKEADIWVFFSPNYSSYVDASFKNLLDRLEPIFYSPAGFDLIDIEAEEANYRSDATPGKLVLISVADKDIIPFKFIVEQMRIISDIFGKHFLTPILRDNCDVLELFDKVGKEPSDIYNALKEAGRQVILQNDFDPQTVNTISRKLTSDDSFLKELTTKL